MLPVIGDPLGQRPLHRHAAEDREGRLDGGARLEGAVGEVAVEADRDAEGANDIHCDHDRDVDGMERDVPENARRDEDPERRDDDRDQRHDLADPARARAHGADGGLQRSDDGDGNFGHGQPIFARRRIAVVAYRDCRRRNLRPRCGVRALARPRGRPVRARIARGRPREHGRARRGPARHRVPRPQHAELPAALPALRRARRADARVGDVVLGQLRGLRARVLGAAAVRAGPERGEPAVPRAAVGDRAVAADSGPVAGRGRLRERVARGLPRRSGLLAAVPLALPGSADSGAVVDRARAGARVPGGVRDPLLRESRDARVRALPLADGDRRKPRVRVGDRRPPRAGAAGGEPGAVDPADGRRSGGSRGGRRGTHVRQGGGRDACRRGSRAARGSERGGVARARRVRLYGQRDRAAHRLVAPAALPGGARLVELPDRRRRPADADLLPEQAAGARVGSRLLRDAQPGRRRGARARAALVHAPALHRRDAAGAGRAAEGVGRAEHALCGRPFRERLPRGRARLRESPLRPRSGWPGEVGAVHRDADALAANAAAERLPLPDLVLAARPGRAARARAPALARPR